MPTPQPTTLLSILCVVASVVGLAMFSAKNHQASPQQQLDDLETQISSLKRENAVLRDHNTRLKALVTADAPVDLPEGTLAFVESTLGFKFSKTPLAFSRSEEILEEAASQFWVAEIGHDSMLARNFALEALGVLPAMSDLLQILTQQIYNKRMVVYDPSSHEIILDLRFDDENIHHQAQLIHACSIALMAERMQAWMIQNNDDARLSQIAAIHARASSASQQFYAKTSRQQGIPLQATNPNKPPSHENFQSEPVTISRFEALLDHFFQSASHHYIVKHPRFIEQPSLITSQAILANSADNEPVTIDQKTPQYPAQSGFELMTKLGVLPVLTFVTGDHLYNEILNTYLCDQLMIEETKEGQFSTTWTIDWTNEAAAAQFVKTISTGTTAQVQSKGSRVTLQVIHSSQEN